MEEHGRQWSKEQVIKLLQQPSMQGVTAVLGLSSNNASWLQSATDQVAAICLLSHLTHLGLALVPTSPPSDGGASSFRGVSSATIAAMSNLTRVDLSLPTDTGSVDLSADVSFLNAAPHLTRLDLFGHGDLDWTTLADALPDTLQRLRYLKLESLDVDTTPHAREKLKPFFQRCINLHTLQLSQIYSATIFHALTDAGSAALSALRCIDCSQFNICDLYFAPALLQQFLVQFPLVAQVRIHLDGQDDYAAIGFVYHVFGGWPRVNIQHQNRGPPPSLPS